MAEPQAVATGVFFQGDRPELPSSDAAPYTSPLEHLDDELHLCDLLIEQFVIRRAGAPPHLLGYEPATAPEPLPQLAARIAQASERLQARVSATRAAGSRRDGLVPGRSAPHQSELPIVNLARRLGLDPIDVRIVVLLLAIELGPHRLARLFADAPDTAVPLPTPLLLHALLADSEPSLPRWLERFTGSRSLVGQSTIVALDDARAPAPLAATPLRVHPRIVSFVLDRADITAELRGRVIEHGGFGGDATRTEVELGRALTGARGHCLWLLGPPDRGGLELCARIAVAQQRPLLEIDLAAWARENGSARATLLDALVFEQRLTGAVALIRWRGGGERAAELELLRAIGARAGGPVVSLSDRTYPELGDVLGGALVHAVARPAEVERRQLWDDELARAHAELDEHERERLARTFALSRGEIAALVQAVARRPRWSFDALFRACVKHQGRRLSQLTDVVVTPFGWDDLVLRDLEANQLREIVAFERNRALVFDRWKMATKLPYGTGLACLFTGPPGTGKTMSASVIANELGCEVHRVDLSRVVDKYIGETEKNLGAVFDAAAEARAVLLFDEADSLFAKRTEVASSHDRYANLETNFLLQRIEEYAGITILTTNLPSSIDEAFLRRIRFKVDFPFPDASARAQIWKKSLTAEVPVERGIAWATLGAQYELAGGDIRSASVRAVFLAAERGVAVSMEILQHAAVAECRAQGKLVRIG